MENVIIAMLYLYPGALVDRCRKVMFHRTYRKEDEGENASLAKYFVYSTVISTITLVLYGFFWTDHATIQGAALPVFDQPWDISKYFAFSLLVMVLFSIFVEKALDAKNWFESKWSRKSEGVVITRSVDAWHELVFGDDFKEVRGALILKIRHGEREEVGFSYYLPERFEDGVALIRTKQVEEAFQKDQGAEEAERLIFGPVAIYCDSRSDTTVEFYNGNKLAQTLQ